MISYYIKNDPKKISNKSKNDQFFFFLYISNSNKDKHFKSALVGSGISLRSSVQNYMTLACTVTEIFGKN